MLNARVFALRTQTLISLGMILAALVIAWEAGLRIAAGDLQSLMFAGLGAAALFIAAVILRNWRSGFYLFFVWLMFEDFARKYLGNGPALFFGKEFLALITYLSLFIAVRRGREQVFRPPFLLPLLLFVWMGAAQVFNRNSSSLLYGLLGFKLYFFYIPMLFVGYALIREERDLRRFLLANAGIAAVIGSLGIAQALIGNSFLNPATLAPALRELGDLEKVSPLTNQILSLPTSVFVSSGRFAFYLELAIIVIVGSAGYLMLAANKRATWLFLLLTTGIIGAAAFLSGSRGALLTCAASVLVLAVGFIWGARWGDESRRAFKIVRRSVIVAALGLAAVLLLAPKQSSSRLAFYSETLRPDSPAYQLHFRAWTYPFHEFMLAFTNEHWVAGNGIGTASLGTQYVSHLLGQPPPKLWVEDGYGVLVLEMGILGPLLWIAWTSALLYSCWRVVRRLRHTHLFPIAFAIFWYALLLLYPLMFNGIFTFQNYINNVFLWLMVGMLFRLPKLLEDAGNRLVIAPRATPFASGG